MAVATALARTAAALMSCGERVHEALGKSNRLVVCLSFLLMPT